MLLHRVVRHVITNPLGKPTVSIFRVAKTDAVSSSVRKHLQTHTMLEITTL